MSCDFYTILLIVTYIFIFDVHFNWYKVRDQKTAPIRKQEWEADSSLERCPDNDWTVLAVAAIYLLFSNLLLVNLVIAMFR